MKDLNMLFRERIDFPEHEKITFENLNKVLDKTAKALPFENLSLIEGNNAKQMTKDNLSYKILEKREGGLCYELNPILYLFLKENGFEARMVLGSVYSQKEQRWSPTGKTHVANLIHHQGEFYLIDTGFGGNLPLCPVPLTGKIVSSANGEFQVQRENTEYGDYVFYMKHHHKHSNWQIGYTFDSKHSVQNIEQLDTIKKIIEEHEASTFNKRMLATKLTDRGSMTLTDNSFTEWIDGEKKESTIDNNQFKEMKRKYFNL